MHRIKPWQLGVLLIVGAAVALGVIGWIGLRNQRAVVWQQARDDCSRWVGQISESLTEKVDAHAKPLATYDFPPSPGDTEFPSAPSLDELRALLVHEGRTPGGLPVRVLSAYHIVTRTNDIGDGHALVDLAMNKTPSVITPKLMEKLETIASDNHWDGDWSLWRDQWERDERAREVARATPIDGWVEHNGEYWWIDYEARSGLRTCPPEMISEQLAVMVNESSGAPWVGAALVGSESSVGDAGQVLATTDLGGLRLQVGVVDAALLESNWTTTRRWAVMMMALALLAVASGLWFIRVGILREKRLAEEKSGFVASVTHELRAPVASMRLIAEALDQGKVSDEKQNEFHRLLASEGARLSCLIENVLDLSQLEKGGRRLNLKPTDVGEIVDEVRDVLMMHAEQREITVVTEGAPLIVTADALALRQILMNLVDNAIKFSPRGGTVRINWGDGWWLSVTDEGQGITPGHEERIFDRFFRGGDEMRRETKGVGIGLSLVKYLVEAHGGTAKVTNNAGASFRLDFPTPQLNSTNE